MTILASKRGYQSFNCYVLTFKSRMLPLELDEQFQTHQPAVKSLFPACKSDKLHGILISRDNKVLEAV